MEKVLLCSAAENLKQPEFLGLPDIDLGSLDWLVCEASAEAIREAARDREIREVWVEGSDDMDALNLGAALHADDPTRPVVVVALDASGSMHSRAQAAGVSALISPEALISRFSIEKERRERIIGVAHDLEANLDAALASQQHAQRKADPGAKASCGTAGTAYILTVLSGSGGAGKSTVSAVAAHAAAAKGHRTLLFDCDLQFGDVAYLCGAADALTADDALADPDRLDALAAETEDGGVAVLAAPVRLEHAEVVSAGVAQLLERASALFDAIVVNTGASWAECHATLIERSDCALFLVDQKASSVRACKHAVGLCERLGIATGNFEYAVNRCSRNAPFTSIDVSCALQSAHVFELKDGGADVEEFLGAGDARELIQARNDLCMSVSALLDDLLPSGASKGTGHKAARKGASAASAKRTSRRRSTKHAAEGAEAAKSSARATAVL